jgi:hypothetical protein
MDTISFAEEGWRMLKRAMLVRRRGIRKYEGNAAEICQKIVKDCWNKKHGYFQASNGHFSEFYMRDFGICAESLMKLGYKDEVYRTMQYCLNIYSKHSKVTTTITPKGRPINVFHYAPDTLAFLIRSLRVAGAKDLAKTYEPFLEKEAEWYADDIIHKGTGLVNFRKYSSMKDHSARKSSCYDNCMSAMLSRELDKLGMKNPLKKYKYPQLIKLNFWHAKYFDDDLYSNYICGDANVFPYWCGIFTDPLMIKKSIAAIQQEGLDSPFPLKYTSGRLKERASTCTLLAPNYEGNTVWLHLGLCYLDVVKKADKELFAKHLEQYTKLIEEHGNLLEVFRPDGTPYKTPVYYADDSMLWAAKYLDLADKL